MLKRIRFIMIIPIFVVISACYYDVEETLYAGTYCSTIAMSYQTNIIPILQRNCYVCHSVASTESDIDLEGYDKLMVYVNSGKLLGSIRHDDGYEPMPQEDSKLIKCDIARIEQWITDGAPDN